MPPKASNPGSDSLISHSTIDRSVSITIASILGREFIVVDPYTITANGLEEAIKKTYLETSSYRDGGNVYAHLVKEEEWRLSGFFAAWGDPCNRTSIHEGNVKAVLLALSRKTPEAEAEDGNQKDGKRERQASDTAARSSAKKVKREVAENPTIA
ncbi:hypothetical protein MMC13_002689 [Lambiella insularis]|nr:hypothetical protein [Lambiella insularis]